MNWSEFEGQAPDLARRVRARLESQKHHVLATLRADGSPRVSGTEVRFFRDDLTLGSMPEARKAADLLRDSRLALHAHPGDGSMEGGDAKLSGRAVEVVDLAEYRREVPAPPGPFHLFRLELTEVVLTSVEGDLLVVESWHEGAGLRRFQRK